MTADGSSTIVKLPRDGVPLPTRSPRPGNRGEAAGLQRPEWQTDDEGDAAVPGYRPRLRVSIWPSAWLAVPSIESEGRHVTIGWPAHGWFPYLSIRPPLARPSRCVAERLIARWSVLASRAAATTISPGAWRLNYQSDAPPRLPRARTRKCLHRPARRCRMVGASAEASVLRDASVADGARIAAARSLLAAPGVEVPVAARATRENPRVARVVAPPLGDSSNARCGPRGPSQSRIASGRRRLP